MRKIWISSLIIIILSTIAICVIKPTIHKPFNLNIINYILNFTPDGSINTTKTTTTTVLEDK